jgi:hypothetical protein
MNTSLPARPNLEHLRTQAKHLLSQLRSDDDAAAQTFLDFLPAAKDMTPDQVRRAKIFTIDVEAAPAQIMLHAKMRLDQSQMPIAVDYLNVGRGAKGVTLGVIELEGDVVRFCVAPAGAARPVDFSCDRGSGRTFSEWRRKA